jgi:hypothetical protein
VSHYPQSMSLAPSFPSAAVAKPDGWRLAICGACLVMTLNLSCGVASAAIAHITGYRRDYLLRRFYHGAGDSGDTGKELARET